MVQTKTIVEQKTINKGKNENKKSLILNIFIEVVAILFWLYLIIKVFVYDIDLYLINKFFPNAVWIINLKFFILLGILAIFCIFVKGKHIISKLLYVIFYPLILLFFKFPLWIFKKKSWILVFAVLNMLISFFKSFKYKFIATAFFLISICLLFFSSNDYVLWISIIALFVILILTYVYSFFSVFKASTIFHLYSKIVSFLVKHSDKMIKVDKELKNLPVKKMDEKQLEKWSSNLQLAVVFNKGCLYLSRKLKEYNESGVNIVFQSFNFILLVLTTAFTLSVINFGLYKIDSSLFYVSSNSSFFTFIFYSFNTLFLNSISQIYPVSFISQTFSMISFLFSLLLLSIIFSLVFSIGREKHTKEINKATKIIEKQGSQIEESIKGEYKLTIPEAIIELEKIKAGMIKIIYFLSKPR